MTVGLVMTVWNIKILPDARSQVKYQHEASHSIIILLGQYKALLLYKRSSILIFYGVSGADCSLINPVTSSILVLSLSLSNTSSSSLLDLSALPHPLPVQTVQPVENPSLGPLRRLVEQQRKLQPLQLQQRSPPTASVQLLGLPLLIISPLLLQQLLYKLLVSSF